MALPEHLTPLLDAATYAHPCTRITLIETHISWVVLTGSFAYKLKKPVRFSFLDFSTLALREHFCREELRCNRSFAPTLYLDVMAVLRHEDGLRLASASDAVSEAPGGALEWAVKMRQFDPGQALDQLLARDELDEAALDAFGHDLAVCHAALPVLTPEPDAVHRRILAPVAGNFNDIAPCALGARHATLLADTQARSHAVGAALQPRFEARVASGHVRECHGDLHLSNLALVDGEVTAFDCLEFNEDLRWIDTLNDVAFLFMDCHYRGKTAMAYRFLDSYLEASGDYDGAPLLSYYAAYRSMVRAKVAALRYEQEQDASVAEQFRAHLQWAHDALTRTPGLLVLMCGLSGSGKSYLARRLLPRLPAVRLRSDTARKQLAGFDALARTDSSLDAGLYSAKSNERTFEYLAASAAALLAAGENVIVDATFIERARREQFLRTARSANAPAVILHCDTPAAVLEGRITARASRSSDPSEATLAVLERQRERFEPPGGSEPLLTVATGAELSDAFIGELAAKVLAVLSERPGQADV